MKDEFLWVDIGGIATTVRALKKFRDEWRVLDTLLWFVPKRYGYSERTKCVLPVVELL